MPVLRNGRPIGADARGVGDTAKKQVAAGPPSLLLPLGLMELSGITCFPSRETPSSNVGRVNSHLCQGITCGAFALAGSLKLEMRAQKHGLHHM